MIYNILIIKNNNILNFLFFKELMTFWLFTAMSSAVMARVKINFPDFFSKVTVHLYLSMVFCDGVNPNSAEDYYD